MRTVYKYKLDMGINKIMIPAGGSLFSAHFDGSGNLCVWAAVDTTREEKEVEVYVGGTGWDIEKEISGKRFTPIDTVVDYNLGLVWHVGRVSA